MPGKLGKPCAEPRCPTIVEGAGRYCQAHKQEEPKAFSRKNFQRNPLYGTEAWQRCRAAKLNKNPLCNRCRAPASIVHHLKPAREFPHLQFTDTNLESLCARCHNQESQREALQSRRRSSG